MSIIIGILVMNFIIIVHELGHYLVAKLSDIKVLQFSLFFGPKIFSYKKGETEFRIGTIPLGAYVLMEGEEEEAKSERSFSNKPMWIRALVIAAGPLMNLITAFLLIVVVFSISGYMTTKISGVAVGSAAYNAGLKEGDVIVKYDNKSVYQPVDVLMFAMISKGSATSMEIIRDNQRINVNITPDVIPQNRYILGFSSKEEGTLPDSNVIEKVSKNYPAESAGLIPGDRIVKLNDVKVSNKKEISAFLLENKEKPVKVTVLRDGKELQLEVIPKLEKYPAPQYNLGIAFRGEKGNLIEISKNSIIYIYANVRNAFLSFGWLITGKVALNQMMGPVGIVDTISDVVKESPSFMSSLLNLFTIAAFISVAVGATNLLPLPALDGGRLLTLIVGMLRGKPISPEKEAYISMAGLVLLIIIGIFTIFNDLFRIFSS